MNLQESLVQSGVSLAELIEKFVDNTLSPKMELLITQVLKIELVETSILLIIMLIITGIGSYLIKFIWGLLEKYREKYRDGFYDESGFWVGMIVSGLVTFLSLVAVFNISLEIYKILYTPDMYLLEYFTGLLKSP